MRILILGGGGLGIVLAGHLARAGEEVTVLVRPAHFAGFEGAETWSGLGPFATHVHVSGLSEFSAPISLTADPAALGEFDYLIVSVKGRDSEAALEPLRGLRVDAALSVQNGVSKNDALIAVFGKERVLGATSAVGGTLIRPGVARHTLAGPTLVGELHGEASARAERLAAAIRASGLPAEAVPDIFTREWHKLAIFLRTALVCSIVRTDVASVMLDPDLVPLCARVSADVAGVAAAEGHSIAHLPVWITPSVSFGRPEAEIIAELQARAREMQAQGVPLYPSLTTDIMAGRPTEVDETAGDVLVRAAQRGVAVPSLAACCVLVKALEGRAIRETTDEHR